MRYTLKSLIICLNITLLLGANILVFLPLPFHSHRKAFQPFFKDLALKGHNVTFYTCQGMTENIPNLKQIVVRDVLQEFLDSVFKDHLDYASGLNQIYYMWVMGIAAAESLFKEPLIQELFHSTNLSFDVVITETFFIHEPFVALGHKFNAPVINIHPFRPEVWINDILRNPQPLSYVPNIRLPMSENMNFYERMLNTFYSVLQTVSGHYYYLPEMDKVMRKYLSYPGSDNLPPLIKLIKNTSLTLLDSSLFTTLSTPNLPNLIHVGGIHILPSKKLPKDIQTFIDDSPNGVIYISFGSMVRVSALPLEKLNIIAKVLGNVSERVLMKWEKGERMPGQLENVLTSNWLPQQDILAHPKCKAFITHGGFHSVFEAAYFGVPIVGVPVLFDQESNLIMARKKGICSQIIKLEDFSTDILLSAISETVNNPSYKRNAEILSKVLKDVPMSPLDTAVFWIEYVIRHRGVPHLQVAGAHLPWYQYYLLDVIFTMLSITAIIVIILLKLLNIIFKFILKIFFSFKNTSNVKIKRN